MYKSSELKLKKSTITSKTILILFFITLLEKKIKQTS